MNARQSRNTAELVRCAREMREKLWNDPHRPRYHLVPPDGFWNDINGTIFWKEWYHVFFLGRMPNPDAADEAWKPVWEHASSRDLVHWIHHPPALVPAFDGRMPEGLYSGDAIENAPIPTLIYHVPGQGTCIATSEDDELIRWTPFPENPVIPMPEQATEYIVFDPCAWKESDAYYALIGNKNGAPGFDGDCTSLFKSTNLIDWEYLHPFYKSDRRWTDEVEDCACPDFFPLGEAHMLLMHGHRPYGQAHYYLGRYENERFYPEIHGRMNWPGGQLAAPETLLDGKGRRIFFGWIREARPREKYGWASVMSLPRVLSLSEDGNLRIEPASELETLRVHHRRRENLQLATDSEVNVEDVRGDCLELAVQIETGKLSEAKSRVAGAREFGIKVRCSPGGEEETTIVCVPEKGVLRIDLAKSTLADEVKYPRSTPRDEPEGIDESERYAIAQEAPFELASGEQLKLRVFLDRSVLEIFANGRQCLTQRIYPTRADSLGVSIFARGGPVIVRSLEAWDMAPVNPW